MLSLPLPMQRLVRELSKLPSIGDKSATRLAYFLVTEPAEGADKLAQALLDATRTVRWCQSCFFFSEQDTCVVCSDSGRDQRTICVVEKPMDVLSIERTGSYRGTYHVLHGLWAPLKGRTPESIRVAELLKRIAEQSVREIILATGSTVEGDATALYIARSIEDKSVLVTRLAQGMPKGGELEYADDVTLGRALAGRGALP